MARLDPLLFNKKTINIATPGEHYFYTFQKIEKLVSNPNKTIKQIIIGVSPINFSPSLQKIFDLRNIEGKSMLKKNIMFIDFNKNEEYTIKNYLALNYSYIAVFWPTEWGGFVKSNNSMTDDKNINNAIDIHYNKRNLYDLSVQEKYLSKIINLCKEKSIKLYCVATPVNNKYRIKIPQNYTNKYNATIQKYLDDATWINFSNEILPDSFFADADHLNYIGTKYITRKVDSIVSTR
jgi:RNase H-fold protein (predicted Holliday junction resolvase)